MNETKTGDGTMDSLGLIALLFKWKKPLIIIAVIAAVASFVFTLPFFIKPKFKSYAIIYPSNLISYSEETPTEQMLQMFQSDYIRDTMASVFDLYRHYEIDTTAKFPKTEYYNTYRDNVKISATEYESIEIEVWDTDPKIAAAICDSIIDITDKMIRGIQRKKLAEVLVISRTALERKRAELDSMEKSLAFLREQYGILDYRYQAREISRAYYKDLTDGKVSSALERAYKNLETKGGEVLSLDEHLWRLRSAYNDLKVQYDNAVRDMTKELTYSNIITKPMPAERKSYPKRSLVMILFTVSVLFLSVLLIAFIENYRHQWKSVSTKK